MSRFLSRHALDIVFLVLVFAAALTIFLLSRANTSESALPAEAAAETTAAPAAKTPAPSFYGVPEAVLTAHLSAAEDYEARRADANARSWTLALGESPYLAAELTYELTGGRISSVALWLPLPEEPESKPKKGSEIEESIAELLEKLSYTQAGAIRTLLSDLLPACDCGGALSASLARTWAEGAIRARKGDDTFRAEASGCQFLAYRCLRGDAYALCMALYADS